MSEAMNMAAAIEQSIAVDDSCFCQLYIRGHVDLSTFLAACKLYRGDKSFGVTIDQVKHSYWRRVPMRWNGVCDAQFVPAKKGPGAFPVTVVDEWLPMFR